MCRSMIMITIFPDLKYYILYLNTWELIMATQDSHTKLYLNQID